MVCDVHAYVRQGRAFVKRQLILTHFFLSFLRISCPTISGLNLLFCKHY